VPGGKRASPPGKRGRKPHAPTPEQRKLVEELSAVGLKQADVARLVGVSITTLVAYYRDELDTGGLKANAAVAKSLFRMATAANKPNVAAAIFWLKVRDQWKEPKVEAEHSHSGKLVVEHVEKPLPVWAGKQEG
jgi:predicted transcriptional regulator